MTSHSRANVNSYLIKLILSDWILMECFHRDLNVTLQLLNSGLNVPRGLNSISKKHTLTACLATIQQTHILMSSSLKLSLL